MIAVIRRSSWSKSVAAAPANIRHEFSIEVPRFMTIPGCDCDGRSAGVRGPGKTGAERAANRILPRHNPQILDRLNSNDFGRQKCVDPCSIATMERLRDAALQSDPYALIDYGT